MLIFNLKKFNLHPNINIQTLNSIYKRINNERNFSKYWI
jgi:hypothetical protein